MPIPRAAVSAAGELFIGELAAVEGVGRPSDAGASPSINGAPSSSSLPAEALHRFSDGAAPSVWPNNIDS